MTNGPGRWSARLYRVLLRLYPRAFRERHGEEMVRFFRDRAAAAVERRGGWGLVRLWAGALPDVVLSAGAERVRAFRRGTGRRGGGGMDGWRKDLGFALRSLRSAPGFAATAVLIIGVAIAATTAIFSVVQGVLLRPLPYPEPDRLVLVWGEMTARGVENFPHSPPQFDFYRQEETVFEGLAAWFSFQQPLSGDGNPVQVDLAGVTEDFFRVLGVRPALGRDFRPEDVSPIPQGAQPGDPAFANNAAVMSHGFWMRRYGGDPDVLGTVVELGGTPTELVGVMPPDFRFHSPATGTNAAANPDLWMGLRLDPANAPMGNVFLNVIGRLEPGVTPEQAQDEADRLAERLIEVAPTWEPTGFRLEVASLHDELTAGVRPVLLSLLGAVFFVLLIACANVASLMLVRASTRSKELSVRAALGGSRGRLMRQLLLEAMVLSAGAALVGVALARLGVDALLALRPDGVPRMEMIGLDGSVLAFAVAASAGSALLFGLLPALRGSRVELADALQDRGVAGGGRGWAKLRSGIVVVEIALTLVLLIGTGLMIRSFVSLTRVDPGFEAEGLLTFQVPVPFQRYPQPQDRARLTLRIHERLSAIPGVESVSGGAPLPLGGFPFNGRWGHEESASDPESFRQANYRGVLPGYFETMGTELLAGRSFTRADQVDSAAVAVVDERMAETAFPGESAVGRRILVRVSDTLPQRVEIVGVVENVRSENLAEPDRETIYMPDRFVGSFGVGWAVRTPLPPGALVPSVREAVRAEDPDIPVESVTPMTATLAEARAPTRFALLLIGVFGVVALLLAVVGLYGVVSSVVYGRTAEIGVRKAFGAEDGSILGMVVRQGMGLALLGIVAGLVAAAFLTRLMGSFLVGVGATDPVTYAAIGLLFAGVAAVACWVPAWRAARIDPARALRGE